MDFDPDAYLASKEKSVAAPAAFDPDAYLASKQKAPDREPSWYDKAKTAVTGEKFDPQSKPGYIQDIVQSAPGALARASSGLAGMASAAYNLNKGPEHGPSTSPGIIGKVEDFLSPPNRTDSNLGGKSLSGLKQLMGSTYQEPQSTPGKVADFALQNIIFGAKKPKDLLNAPQTLKNLIAGTAGGTAGELVPDDMPKLKMAAQMVGGFSPTLVETAMKSGDRATKNAAAMIKQAMAGKTENDWAAADALFQASKKTVPLTGPEAFPGGSQVQQLASDVAASPAAGAKIREFTGKRADQVQASVKDHLKNIGNNVGGQESVNQMEAAGTKVIQNAEAERSKAVGEYYAAAKNDRVPVDSMTKILSKVDAAIAADKTGIIAPKLQEFKDTLLDKSKKSNSDTFNGLINEDPKYIEPPHEIRDYKKFDDLYYSMKNNGWIGRPILAIDIGNGSEAITGSHRIVAARKAGIEVPVLKIDSSIGDYQDISGKTIRDAMYYEADDLSKYLKDAGYDDASKLAEYEHLSQESQRKTKSLKSLISESLPKPITDIENLDRARKYFRDKIELPAMSADAMPKEVSKALGPFLDQIRNEMEGTSANYQQGKALYQAISRDRVDPLMKGPVGKVAGKGADAQREASYTRIMSELGSETANPERIKNLATEIGKVDKDAFPNVTRAYLESKLNTSLKDLQGRRNPSSGANFRNAVEGTPKDKANLQAMIEETAKTQGQDPKKAYSGFRNLLDVLDATGRVPGMGSQTQSRMENAAMARKNPVSGAVETVSTTPTHRIARWMDDMMYKGTYSKLADVFTSPESIKEMQKLSKLKPNSIEAQNMVSLMLTSAAQGAKDDDNDKK